MQLKEPPFVPDTFNYPVEVEQRRKVLQQARHSGAADKAAIQRVRVLPCQLPDPGT